MEPNILSVFVSYNRADAKLVKPIVDLIRATRASNEDWVFYDQDSIQAGQKWRAQTERALSDADLVCLFWCAHASMSTEVEHEYTQGLTEQKNFLPVILDATPVPSELAEYQFIDMQDVGLHTHKPKSRAIWLSVASTSGALLVAFAVFLFLPVMSGNVVIDDAPARTDPGYPTDTPIPKDVDPAPSNHTQGSVGQFWLGLVAVLMTIFLIIGWVVGQRRKKQALSQAAASISSAMRQTMKTSR